MLNEFKEFAMKGNLVDMAVGFILGTAFSTVVKSLVNDIIMPPIGLAMGGVDFSKLAFTLQEAGTNDAGEAVEAVTINYGAFINNIISFVIVALCLFFIIKGMNAAKKKEEEAPEAPAEPPKEEVLLTEIRDLLAKQ